MKHFLFLSTLFLSHTGVAAATTLQYASAQSISAISIATLQHTITQNLFSSFSHRQDVQTSNKSDTPSNTPLYGTALVYGEYNDDGQIGRNGGDVVEHPLSNIWLDWHHTNDDIIAGNLDRYDSRHDVITVGIYGNEFITPSGHYNWNFYGGYINGSLNNTILNSQEHGGFIGLHNKLHTHDFIINSTINTGSLKSKTDFATITDDYTNVWFGIATDIAYNIKLSNNFNLYPDLFIGYTWTKNQKQDEVYGTALQNHTFGFFEISPGLKATKHFGLNWFGTLNVKYTTILNTDKNLTINDTIYELPTIGDYTEYGIAIEKHTTNFVFNANINRRDGDLSGWSGGLNIKYVF